MAYGGPKLAGVKWTGLDTFMQELQVLTSDLVDEANTIMTESAEAAKADIAAAYPQGPTGNLKRGLVLRDARGTLIAGKELVQTAPHGYLYEHGTRPRYNQAGAYRGVMPGNPTFEPIAYAYRRTAISSIMFRLYQHGATRVTGDPDTAA
jgi:hypothetical protein